MELDALWLSFEEDANSFDRRRILFFDVLRRLLLEKKIDLINMHTKIPMNGSIEEQLKGYERAFPEKEDDMKGGLRFFFKDCPRGSSWRPTGA